MGSRKGGCAHGGVYLNSYELRVAISSKDLKVTIYLVNTNYRNPQLTTQPPHSQYSAVISDTLVFRVLEFSS